MKHVNFLNAAIAVLVAASFAYATLAEDRQRVTKINGDRVSGDVEVVSDVDLSGIGEGTDTNAVRDIVDSSFVGGTQEVNRVTGAFDGVTGELRSDIEGISAYTGVLESQKRNKRDLSVGWTWATDDPNCPSALVAALNRPDAPTPNLVMKGAVGEWGLGEVTTNGVFGWINFTVSKSPDAEAIRFGFTDERDGFTPKYFATATRVTSLATVADMNDATNGLLRVEADPTVADWAKKPNPAPVTDLTPAFDYTTAVSNKLENGKQDRIEDLDAIRDGAAKGATALQEHQSLEPATNYTDAAVAAATNGIRSVDGAARPLPKYLHALDFDDTYPSDSAWYYAQPQDYGSCSAVREGGYLYRNYDWKFDDAAEFVVKVSAAEGRFASVGVANVGTNITEVIATSGKQLPPQYYKALPGRVVDGINENGVVCEVNVVDGEPPASTGGDIHPCAAVRWALDNGTSAGMVASNLAARIAFPSGWTQNFHWMIADERETWIVENGTAYPIIGRPVMTNFRIAVDPPDGPGVERYNLLMNPANSITNAWFTRCYSAATSPKWASEFGGDEDALDTAIAYWATKPKEQHRGETFAGKSWWQSVHTSVYDLTNRTLRIAVQETDDWYTFQVPAAGGVKVETDPTVPAWAKQANPPIAPVQSVNGRTGDVVLTGSGVVTEDVEGEGAEWIWNGMTVDEALVQLESSARLYGDDIYDELRRFEGEVANDFALKEDTVERFDGYAESLTVDGGTVKGDVDATGAAFKVNPAHVYLDDSNTNTLKRSIERKIDRDDAASAFVRKLFTINGRELSGNGITLEEMTDNALVLTNGAVKTKGGTAVTPANIGAVDSVNPNDTAMKLYWLYGIGGGLFIDGIMRVGGELKFDVAEGSRATFAEGSRATFDGGSQATFAGGSQATFDGGSQATFAEGSRARFDEGGYVQVYNGYGILFEDKGIEEGTFYLENIDERIRRLAPAPGNYAAVSNAAMNAMHTVTNADANLIYTITSDGAEPRFYFTPVGAINAED